MSKITITEALSELNLIKKKIEKKRAVMMGMLVTAKHIKDPFENVGGAIAYIKSEVQSIDGLSNRFIKLKSGIAKANIENSITINDNIKCIHDWLIWKRDVAQLEIKHTEAVYNEAKRHLDHIQNKPQIFKDEAGNTHLVEPISNIDQSEWLKKSENLSEIFEKLDGQLSLKNATIVIDV